MSPVSPIGPAAAPTESSEAAPHPTAEQRLRELLSGMLNLPLYAMWRTAVHPDVPAALLVEHLTWMIEQEDRGVIFASGPFQSPDARTPSGGLTILRADDEAAARRIVDDDPLVKTGAVTYELKKWVLMEGDLNIRISCSRRRARLV